MTDISSLSKHSILIISAYYTSKTWKQNLKWLKMKASTQHFKTVTLVKTTTDSQRSQK